MKKILHISKYYFPFRGGTEQIAQDCVAALKEKYEQKVICFNHERGNVTDEVDGVEVTRVDCFAKIASQSLSFYYKKILKKLIKEFKPDIIVFHYPNPFAAHFLLKYLAEDTKLVVYWHLDIMKQVFLRKFFRHQNRKLIERADKLIATSPNYIDGSFWLRQVREKCVAVPNCININRFRETDDSKKMSEEIRRKNQGKTICLAVGRHTEYKGFSYLIKASKYLDDSFKIYIVGKGELTARLKEEAKADDKIEFLGLLSDEELKAYMSAMDIFCFPSITKNEAFGLALAEGMYYGKPAVTFTIEGSGVNYVSIDGETGIEVANRDSKAYADAIKKLASDDKLRNKLGTAAKKRVEDIFLYDSFMETIRQIINKI